MTGWVIKVSENTPHHAQFAMEDGLWDIRSFSTFKNLAPGDDVFFWVGGGKSHSGLKGHGRVTSPLEELNAESATARWDDRQTGGYTHRFTFEPLADAPASDPTWTDIEQLIGKRLAPPSPGNPIVDNRHLQLLRSLYRKNSPQFDVEFPTNLYPNSIDNLEPYEPKPGEDSREFAKRSIAIRRGSKKFREALIVAYQSRCAITRFDALGSLEAAHINPYRGAGTDHVQNGLLLRADVHTLFDLHQLTVDAEYRVALSPELLASAYGRLHGTDLLLPTTPDLIPSKGALASHRKDCDWYSEP